MYIANFFLQGEIGHGGLPQWLAEQTGLFGGSADAVALAIWVNSEGGDVTAAMEAINLMKASPIPVVTIINGCAESAGLLISAAGHVRLAFENSWGMAHHFSTGLEGNYHDIQETIKHHQLLHNAMADILTNNSNLSRDEVERDLLGRGNNWLSSKDLLDVGLIDEILKPGQDIKQRIIGHVETRTTKTTQKKRKVSKQS